MGEQHFNGGWYGRFFGNDATDTSAHPTGVAGVFGSYVWNNNGQADVGLTGSFGAHRQ